jgi:hypothetical protein
MRNAALRLRLWKSLFGKCILHLPKASILQLAARANTVPFASFTVSWTHAITIDAPPEAVWPWIAQLGDERGGFYSFTFFENQVGALTGRERTCLARQSIRSIRHRRFRSLPGKAFSRGLRPPTPSVKNRAGCTPQV